ncbi:MAG: hypothetical protein R3B92_02140 [Patescibacteria group bacterium]
MFSRTYSKLDLLPSIYFIPRISYDVPQTGDHTLFQFCTGNFVIKIVNKRTPHTQLELMICVERLDGTMPYLLTELDDITLHVLTSLYLEFIKFVNLPSTINTYSLHGGFFLITGNYDKYTNDRGSIQGTRGIHIHFLCYPSVSFSAACTYAVMDAEHLLRYFDPLYFINQFCVNLKHDARLRHLLENVTLPNTYPNCYVFQKQLDAPMLGAVLCKSADYITNLYQQLHTILYASNFPSSMWMRSALNDFTHYEQILRASSVFSRHKDLVDILYQDLLELPKLPPAVLSSYRHPNNITQAEAYLTYNGPAYTQSVSGLIGKHTIYFRTELLLNRTSGSASVNTHPLGNRYYTSSDGSKVNVALRESFIDSFISSIK